MRKLLLALAAAASILGAGAASYLTAAPLAYLTATSGCNEASQLLACLNSQVYGLLNGATAPATTSLLPLGLNGGTATSANVNITMNAQRGILLFTSTANVASQAGITFNLTDSFVTASSMCSAWVTNGLSANSDLHLVSANTSAGNVAFVLYNSSNTTIGGTNVNLAFQCM